MTKYTRMEERPLSDIIEHRKNHYIEKVKKAFDTVYKSGNFAYISQFEDMFSKLSEEAIQGNLEKILIAPYNPLMGISIETKVPKRRTRKIDIKPRLTSYQYGKARDKGMTNEKIREKFRMNSPHQICGFARQYTRRKDKKTAAS